MQELMGDYSLTIKSIDSFVHAGKERESDNSVLRE